MRAYIKSASSFATTGQREVVDYKLTLDSQDPEKSSVTVVGDDVPASTAGSWLVLDGEVWLIDQVRPKKGTTELQLLPVICLFDRDLVYDEDDAESTIGAYIASLIGSEWINQTDSVYATTYLTVTSTDTTAFEPPETDDDGIFNLLEYITLARKTHNIGVHAALSGNTLALTISADTAAEHPLVINDGHTQLVSSSFSSECIAKLTVFQPVDTGTVDADNNPIMETTTTDWYLAADGTASTTVPAQRAVGSWGSISIGKDDDQQEKVEEKFAENADTLKIELYSDRNMNVGDTIRVRIGGEITEGTIAAISRKKSDSRKLFRVGNLATTLQEKVNAMQPTDQKVVVRSGGGGEVLPAWTPGSY